MGQTEYIVRFRGDYSALQKDINKINGETKKLADDEVIIKLNYDGNIKEFNKVFDQISKLHPELGIQFQYNVNQKLLEQEMDKAKQLAEIKLDIDDNKVQGKLESFANGIERALQDGLSKDDITRLVRNYFGYYNTAIDAGAKNIDIDSINNRLADAFSVEEKDIKNIFDNVFDINAEKPIKLFKIDSSVNDDLLKTNERIEDIKDTLEKLESRGASKSGLPSEFEKLQDEIKILRSNLQDMQGELKNLSGDAFKDLTEEVEGTKQKLFETIEAVDILNSKIHGDIPGAVNQNRKVAIFDGYKEQIYDIYDDAEALDKKLDEMAGKMKNPAWHGGDLRHKSVNSSEFRHADSFQFALDRGGNTSGTGEYSTFNYEDVLDWIMSRSSDTKKMGLFTLDLGDYNMLEMPSDDYYEGLTSLYGAMHRLVSNELGLKEYDLKGLDSPENIFNRYEQYFKDFNISLEDFIKFLGDEKIYLSSLNPSLGLDEIETVSNRFMERFVGNDGLGALNTLMDDSVSRGSVVYPKAFNKEHPYAINWGGNYELARKFFDKVKMRQMETKAANPQNDPEDIVGNLRPTEMDYKEYIESQEELIEHLKTIQKNDVTIQSLNREILNNRNKSKNKNDDYKESHEDIGKEKAEQAAQDVTQQAADALQKAQDSNSPAELTKPLGKDFGEGYAEGIKEAIPDIVDACREIVLAAYNALKEAKESDDGENLDFSEGFINSFKESLNNAIPTLQEKIKEVFSKIDIGDENESLFTGIGQEIIDSIIIGLKNSHSAESFTKSLENIIKSAFTQVALDNAVRDFLVEIQTNLDTQGNLRLKYFSVDSDSIVFEIQNALDNQTFKINLGDTIQGLATTLNTSADNVRLSFIDAIKWMREANEFQRTNDEETRERTLFYNSKTGEFSNPAVIGDTHAVNGITSDTVKYNELMKGKKFDTDLHWHQDWSTAAPSPQDLLYDFINAYEDGIEKFVVGAQNELTEIDFSKIAKDGQELAEKARSYLSNNIKSVEEALDEFIDRNGEREGITYYDSANVDSIISRSDSDVRRLYGQYLKAILDNEWNELKNDFIEKAQKAKYDDYVENAFFDFTLLQSEKNKIGDAIGNLGLTDIFGDSKYTIALPKEISSNLDFSSFSNDFFISLMNNVKKGIDYTSFDGSMQSIREVVEETFEDTIDLNYQDILGNKFEKFKEFTIQYASEFIDNLFTDIQTKLTEEESNEAYQQAGKQALKNISEKTLLKESVNTYTHDEFEQKYGANLSRGMQSKPIKKYTQDDLDRWLYTDLDEVPSFSYDYFDAEDIARWKERLLSYFPELLENQVDELYGYMRSSFGNDPYLEDNFLSKINDYVAQNARQQQSNIPQSQPPFSPTIPEDFKQQLQNAINETGKYIVKVYGELVGDFKSELQQAIENLGAFPIEVRPYMRKGGEIEEVDLPSGGNNSAIYDFYKKYGTPSQAMDRGFNTDEVLQMLGGKFADIDYNAETYSESRLNAEFFKELIKQMNLAEDQLTVVKAALIEVNQLAEGGEYRHLMGDVNASNAVQDRLNLIQQILKGEREIGEQELANAQSVLRYTDQFEDTSETPISTKPTSTPLSDNIQSEVDAVDQAIKTEEERFDDLKHKIADEIPEAIEEKNNAFDEELTKVNEVVDAETTKLSELEQKIKDISDKAKIDLQINHTETEDEDGSDSNGTKGKKGKSKKGKNDGYDDKEASKRVQQLEKEIHARLQSLDVDGYITSIDRMYDSHDNLAQALIRAEKTVTDADGKLVKQTQRLNIKYDKKGGIAYTSVAESDNYKATDAERRKQAEAEEKRINNLRAVSAKNAELEKKAYDNQVNSLLQQQEASYTRIWNIRKKIASLNPDKDSEQIQGLKEKEKLELQTYNDYTKQLKVLDDTITSQQLLNNLIKVRKDAEQDIAIISKKQQDDQRAKDSVEQAKEELRAKAEVNNLLFKQKTAYQDVLNIEKQIARLDSEKNAEEIAELESQKKEALEVYAQRTKELKAVDEIANAEAQANTLLEMRKKNLKEISIIRAKKADKNKNTITDQIPDDKENDPILGYSDAQNKVSSLLNKIKILQDSKKYTDEFIGELNKAEEELTELSNKLNELKNGSVPFEKISQEVTTVSNNIERTLAKKALNSVKLASDKTFANIKLRIDQIIAKNTAMGKSFESRFINLRNKLNNALSIEEAQQLMAEVNKLESEVIRAGKTGVNFIDRIKNRLKDINSKYIAQYFSFQDILRYARTAFDTIRELDTQMVDLRKTTAMNGSELNDFYKSSSDVAKQLGVTTSEIIQQASSWSRLGYNTKQASTEMAKLSSQFASISPGVGTDEAQTGLVSIMKAWDVDVDRVSRDIMDNINTLGNNFAETNGDIITGMEKAGATLSAIGTDIPDSFALFTGAQEVIQNAETVGTALKTLSLRIRGKQLSLPPYGESYMLCA